jgi:hypothetical protein
LDDLLKVPALLEAVATEQDEEGTRMLSMVELKDLARRLLLNTSELRDSILSEPDDLSTDEVAIKVRVYSKLLRMELGI